MWNCQGVSPYDALPSVPIFTHHAIAKQNAPSYFEIALNRGNDDLVAPPLPPKFSDGRNLASTPETMEILYAWERLVHVNVSPVLRDRLLLDQFQGGLFYTVWVSSGSWVRCNKQCDDFHLESMGDPNTNKKSLTNVYRRESFPFLA